MNKKNHNLIVKILEELNVKARNSEIKTLLSKYYYTPNLNELSYILSYWNVKNMMVKIPIEKIKEAPLPIVVLANDDDFFLITKALENSCNCFYPDTNGERLLKFDELSGFWSGVCLLLEASNYSGEINYITKKNKDFSKKLNTLFFFISSIFLIILGGLFSSNIALYSLSSLGFFISFYLLLREKSYFDNHSIDLCKIGAKFDCDKVISSRESKIFGMSLSELSISFFLFMLSGLAISSFTSQSFSFLIPFIYISAIAIFYSAILQIKMSTYCVLCLSISLVLILMNVYAFNLFDFDLHGINYLNLILALLLTLTTVLLLTKYLSLNKEYKNEVFKNSSLANSSLILGGFKKSKIINEVFENEIEIGNKSSTFSIIFFMNPDCKRCKSMLKELPRLFDQFNNDINLRLLYSGPSDNNSESKLKFASCYEKLHEMTDKDKLSSISNYSFSNLEVTSKKGHNILADLTSQYIWSNDLDLNTTPSLILNGVILPSYFGIEELLDIMMQISN